MPRKAPRQLIVYRLLGFIGIYPGMIITYTMFNMPLALWVIKGFIDEVPKSLDDAAKVDGFSTTATVLKIILPQLGAALAAVILLNLIFVWNEFLFIYILGGKALRTMPVAIYAGIYTEKGVDWEYVSSLSTIHILPIVVAAFILQKYLTRGLTFGMRRSISIESEKVAGDRVTGLNSLWPILHGPALVLTAL